MLVKPQKVLINSLIFNKNKPKIRLIKKINVKMLVKPQKLRKITNILTN